MKLKLDENLSRHLKPILIELGHDVLTAADENLLSRPDVWPWSSPMASVFAGPNETTAPHERADSPA